MDKIDFVVTWVDGNDPEWQAEREKYLPGMDAADGSVIRYRDWDLMRYWFRGVEKFAPWVNKVYFVTCGHYPEWLNLAHPKLVHIKHTDYIPMEKLPTYNSNVIELYIHNIPDLSEQFVLFNDDMFLTDYVKETDFFMSGLPCETVRLGQVSANHPDNVFPHTILNNMAIINKHFNKRQVMKEYWSKFFSLKYGKDLLHNILQLPYPQFSAFFDTHLPTSHLKSTFETVWMEERKVFDRSGMHRFRSRDDVTHWLFKCWRICEGKVVPRSNKWGKYLEINQFEQIVGAIRRHKYKVICISDSADISEISDYRKGLVAAFEKILPEKSSFEIDD